MNQVREGHRQQPPESLAPKRMACPAQSRVDASTILSTEIHATTSTLPNIDMCSLIKTGLRSRETENAKRSRKSTKGRDECSPRQRTIISSKGLPWHSMEILQRLHAVHFFAQRVTREVAGESRCAACFQTLRESLCCTSRRKGPGSTGVGLVNVRVLQSGHCCCWRNFHHTSSGVLPHVPSGCSPGSGYTNPAQSMFHIFALELEPRSELILGEPNPWIPQSRQGGHAGMSWCKRS